MNIPEFVKLAKKVLNEHAGSEGMEYQLEAKSGLKTIETDQVKIVELNTKNGVTTAKVLFSYPQDYGFAVNTIKNVLPEIEIVTLKLVY